MIDQLKQQAVQVLQEELDPNLNYDLQLEQMFDSHPLREQGTTALFSCAPFPDRNDKLFMFVGNVLPMIYPDYNLTNDEWWAVHIGTEYFIKMGVQEDTQKSPAKLLPYLKEVATVFQEQLYIVLSAPPRIEKVYLLENQRHVVGKAQFDGKVYSWIVGDITNFVYKKDLPPQIIWSLHMGRLLLM